MLTIHNFPGNYLFTVIRGIFEEGLTVSEDPTQMQRSAILAFL